MCGEIEKIEIKLTQDRVFRSRSETGTSCL